MAIQTATANLNLKADRYEWQCIDFVQKILFLVGIVGEDAEKISFVRRCISNDSETIQNIYTMRDDVSQEWALKTNPYVNSDEIDDIIKQQENEQDKKLKKAEEAQQRQMLMQGANNAVKGANGDGELQEGQVGQSQQAESSEGQKGQEVSPKSSKTDEETEE